MSAQARPPAAAGRFYPGEPAALRAVVDGLLASAPEREDDGRIVAALLPHAGYEYSGPAAARACRALAGLEPEVVAVVGTSHYAESRGIFLDDHPAWLTPLGEIPIAQPESQWLLQSGAGVTVSPAAHAEEHSVEAVLPFLQRTFRGFRLLPVVASADSLADSVRFGRALAAALKGKKALVIAASDLSHFPTLEVARQADPASLESFLTLDPDYLWRTDQCLLALDAPQLSCTWCGKAAAAAVQAAAKDLGADWGEALACANSADHGGDAGRTVGYGAALLLARGRNRPWPTETISPEEKTELLALALSLIHI